MSTLTLEVDDDLEAAMERLKKAFDEGPPAPVPLPRIQVTGKAVHRRLPDRAVIGVGVEGDRADTDTEARKKLAGRVGELMGLVKGLDCRPAAPTRCRKTTVGEGDEKEEWFTATTTVVLRLEPEDFLAVVLNLLRQGFALEAPTYEFDTPGPLGSDLHGKAAADGRSKLEAIAEAACFRLGEVIDAKIPDTGTGEEPSRSLLHPGFGRGVDHGQKWENSLLAPLNLSLSLPWRRLKDGPGTEFVEPVVEDLDPAVDEKVIDLLKGAIPVQATTVMVDLTVEVLPLG